MPSLPGLDDIEVVPQDEGSRDCVPACIATILRAYGNDIELEEVKDALEEVGDRTDFEMLPAGLSAVSKLIGYELDAVALEHFHDVEAVVNAPDPHLIVAQVTIDPEVLRYHGEGPPYLETYHAVVVRAIDQHTVWVLDPLSLVFRSTVAPTPCDRLCFEAIWECGYAIRYLN
jgi:ABC-type bacteriocin/lantibiotic exporter with double-glycine peptidase domain